MILGVISEMRHNRKQAFDIIPQKNNAYANSFFKPLQIVIKPASQINFYAPLTASVELTSFRTLTTNNDIYC